MSGSSIGTIAGGVVGGIIGFFAGGNVALGATLGMAIGGAIGGALDPPKTPELKGPRLGDLSVQTSTYGAIIPRNYGVVAQYGNIFWLQNDKITEVETDASAGGKGGFGKPKQKNTTFSYFATFAVGLCEGPIDGIKKMWIGSDLVYDGGSTVISDIIASNAAAQFFKLYLGTDTQLPDPSIQADKGIANTPAYRGLAYIVFNEIPLEKYNNSLLGAQVKVEIVKSGILTDLLSLQGVADTDTVPYHLDASGDEVYLANYASTTVQRFNVANYISPIAIDRYTLADIPTFVKIVDKSVYILNFFTNKIQMIGSAGYISTDSGPRSMAISGGLIYVVNWFSATLQIFVLNIATPTLLGTIATQVHPEDIVFFNNFAYVICNSFYLQIFDLTEPSAPILKSTTLLSSAPLSIVISGNYIFIALLDDFLIKVYNVSDPVAPSFVSSISTGTSKPYDLALSDEYLYALSNADDKLQVYDISNPASLVMVASAATSDSPKALAVVDKFIYVVAEVNNKLQIFVFGPNIIASTATNLATIVQAECLNSNLLSSSDLDVTELTDIVRGYRVSAMGAIRGGIEPLRSSWPFDVMQHGYEITFKKRGSASIATIPSSALDARSAGAKSGIQITNAREMDSILAKKVTIKYLDNTREYDTNEQYAARINTDAVNEISIEIPVVFNAQEAAKKAEVLLYLYWMERYDISFVLPYTYANLEPGDVITLNGENATYELRLTTLNTLPDGRIECRAKHSKAALYSPVALGEEGQSVGAGMILPGSTTYELLDIPMLRDADDTPGFPAAMTGYLAGWPGGVLFRSEDGGQTFTSIEDFASPGSTIGFATTSMTAHGGTVLDKSSTLAVILYQGTLSSITEAQLFAGSNWFAYGVDTRWEIMAAQKCVLQGDGSYILSDFLRGQNGTEWATGLHVAFDKIILLDTARLAFIASQSAAIGVAKLYRGITAGKALASESNRSFTYNAVNLECLSPCALTGDRHPTTNDWALIWTRRSRFAGWRDLVDAALGETTESYEVDIFSSGTYTTLKRTLTSSTQTVAYTSAQQVTDFGSNQATLYIKIYQLSATVGRGYPLIATITR